MTKNELIREVIKCTHYQGNEKQKFNKYRQLLSLYYRHKVCMQEIITNLHKYASFKSYLYLLSINKDDELENIIFLALINTLRDDIRKCDNNQEISTLAKWLPRENSSFDKKLNFVNRFIFRFFPEIFSNQNRDIYTNLNIAKKQYRLVLTKLNKYLGTLEVLLCAKETKIDYEKLSTIQLNKYFYKFLKEDNIAFINFLKNKYMEMGIKIIDYIYNNNIKHQEEKDICDQIWNIVKFKYYNQMDMFEKNSDLLVDITNDMYENKVIDKIFTLILMFTENSNVVYLNKNKLVFDNQKTLNIFDKINSIKQSILLADEIIIPNNPETTNNTLYVITKKDVQNIKSFENYDKIIICKLEYTDETFFKIEKEFTRGYFSKLNFF